MSAADLINIQNLRVSLQNNHVIDNYNKILNLNNDIDKLALALKNARHDLALTSMNNDFPVGFDIKTIKSVDKGSAPVVLSLNPAGENDTYQVNINGQCLTVYSKKDVRLKPCQMGKSVSDSQKFSTDRIQTKLGAQAITKEKYINPAVVYPYNIFRSSLTGECMTLDDAGDIVLKQCSGNNIKQQWLISPDEKLCKD